MKSVLVSSSFSSSIYLLSLLIFQIAFHFPPVINGLEEDALLEEEQEPLKTHIGPGNKLTLMKKNSEISPNVGLIEELDPQDFPISGLTPQQALDLLFERYKARMLELHEPRMFGMHDLSENEIDEICGTDASLQCGKKVLKSIQNRDSSTANIHRKCNLRKNFLDCIDDERVKCRSLAEEGIYPRLPPKSIIRSTQSKIWRGLWTSGGCVLAD